MNDKKIYISVINDLATDQRVQRIARTLSYSGHMPVLIGRRFKDSPSPEQSDFRYRRFRLIFNNGFLFYACYNIRLFLYLVTRRKIALYVSNDLDTLPANYLASLIRGKKLVYDSHEYFTEVPELIDRPFVKKFWERIESFLVPKLKFAYTVNESLAKMYSVKYGVHFHVVRNVPEKNQELIDYKLPDSLNGKKVILYQGAVNRDRGLEEMIRIMPSFPEAVLVIAGEGDVLNDLKSLCGIMNLGEQVYFTGRLCPVQLKSLTKKADLGISLEKKTNLNYYYALPNKIFDYIQAGIPFVCSSFPEMKRIIDDYEVGLTVDITNSADVVKKIRTALFDEELRKNWKKNSKEASDVLSWKNEQLVLVCIYNKAGLEIRLN